jgi:hypothetical protein
MEYRHNHLQVFFCQNKDSIQKNGVHKMNDDDSIQLECAANYLLGLTHRRIFCFLRSRSMILRYKCDTIVLYCARASTLHPKPYCTYSTGVLTVLTHSTGTSTNIVRPICWGVRRCDAESGCPPGIWVWAFPSFRLGVPSCHNQDLRWHQSFPFASGHFPCS